MMGPVVRTLFSARALFWLSALFIFYATTIPWDFARAPALDRVAWIPLWDAARGRPPSLTDLVQNVVLFLPFGFFGGLSLGFARRTSTTRGALGVGLLGLMLSLLVELLQTMSLERSPSASDLTTNLAGAVAGAAAALLWARHLESHARRVLFRLVEEQPGLLVLGAYVVVVTAGALAPFIPTLDVGALRASVRSLLDHPWGTKPLGALATDGLSFLAVSFLFTREVPPLLVRRGWLGPEATSRVAGAVLATIAVGLLAAGLELAQLFIVGHSPGAQDAAVGLAGAAVGAVIAASRRRGPLQAARALGDLTRESPALVLGFAVLAPLIRALAPFELTSPAEKLALLGPWHFVPFYTFFGNINLATFRNVFEAALYYVPLGYALHALHKGALVVFLAAFAIAELGEILQLAIAGRTFDVTEGIFAGAGALLGAWLFDQLRRTSV